MNRTLSIPIIPIILICRYSRNNFSQFHTCPLLQPSFLHGKWSSKHSVLSMTCLLDKPLLQVLRFSTIYMMLEPQPPTRSTTHPRLIVPLSTICEYGIPAVPVPQLHEELVTYENGPFSRQMHPTYNTFNHPARSVSCCNWDSPRQMLARLIFCRK